MEQNAFPTSEVTYSASEVMLICSSKDATAGIEPARRATTQVSWAWGPGW